MYFNRVSNDNLSCCSGFTAYRDFFFLREKISQENNIHLNEDELIHQEETSHDKAMTECVELESLFGINDDSF
jgi:hypothetical protein